MRHFNATMLQIKMMLQICTPSATNLESLTCPFCEQYTKNSIQQLRNVHFNSANTRPTGPGGHGNQLIYGPPQAGGSLYAAVFASVMIKLTSLLHPFIR